MYVARYCGGSWEGFFIDRESESERETVDVVTREIVSGRDLRP